MHNNEPIMMNDLADDDKPREKALRNGIRSLSNAELIAILFGNGIRGKSVLTMSQELLAANKWQLSILGRKSIQSIIKENPGIGPAKAISLAAAIELGRRYREEPVVDKPIIKGSETVYELMRDKLELLTHEEFWVLMLNRQNKVEDTVRLSQGGSVSTVVDTKLLFKQALERGEGASALVLVHNHPSGNIKPSPQDDQLTKKIVDGGQLLDIRVLDHVIITDHGYYSYNDNGRI